MKNKILLSENKRTFKFMLTRLSSVYGMGLMLMLLALFTTQCKEDDFTGEVVGVCPEVILTSPLNGDINVVTNKLVTATFNEAMDPSTIDETTFILKKNGNPISGTVTYSGTVATFRPTNLLTANTVYSATINRNVADPMGSIMRKDTTWSFNTGSVPTVILTNPINGTSDAALNEIITVDFSTAIDPLTINSTTFFVKQGTTSVSGGISYMKAEGAIIVAGKISTAGQRATFTPTGGLAANKVYQVTVTNGVKDIAGNALAKDTTWSFATGTLPIIILTDPLNAGINVAVNRKVNVTFSRAMNSLSITPSAFTLKQGTNLVLGLISYQDMTATFTPTLNLLPGTEYTATVTTDVKDLANNSILKDSTWKFTTSVFSIPVLPVVMSTDPNHLETDVALNKTVVATFSKSMDPTTINSSTFKLMKGLTPVYGFVTYVGVDAIFTPVTPLLPATIYEATITTGAKDIDGNAMAANKIWSFTTKAFPFITLTDPQNQAVNVATNKVVTATFNKAMSDASINASTFTLKQGTNSVLGIVSYLNMVASFAPSVTLLPGVEYTATITTGVKDLANNPILKDSTWKFTTSVVVVPVLPIVVSTDPNNLDVNVALNKSVTATFNKAMNASTINASTFIVMDGLIPVPGVVTYVGNVATFNPNAPLTQGTEYTATVTTGVKDMDANAMAANKTWKFTTIVVAPILPIVVSTDPNNMDVNVALNKSVTATFNKTMNASTINASTFILMDGLIPVLGVVTYVGNVATFNPNAPLLPGTEYTATVTTGVKDMDANAMAANKTWKFTTLTPIVKYTVSLVSFPVAGGTTNGAGQFDAGSNVSVVATANAGYKFEEWTDGGLQVSTSSNYSFVINNNRTLMAVFSVVNLGPPGVDLGAAGRFAILAGSGISNTGVSTMIIGDVGAFPTATINGLLSGNVNGILYTTADPLVGTAKTALTTAYNDAQGRSLNAISLPGQLGGLTLAPGLYVNSSTSGISGTGPQGILTLDAGGNPNSVWIFKMGSTLITDAGTKIVLAGGAQAKNIYWSVGTSATLGTNSIFFGNILADQAITLTTGATLTGRALTRIAAVTLDSNTVTKP